MSHAEPGKIRVRVLSRDRAGLRLRVLHVGHDRYSRSTCTSWALHARLERGVVHLRRDIDQPTVHERMLCATDLAELPPEAVEQIRILLGGKQFSCRTPNQLALRGMFGAAKIRKLSKVPLDLSHAIVLDDLGEPVERLRPARQTGRELRAAA